MHLRTEGGGAGGPGTDSPWHSCMEEAAQDAARNARTSYWDGLRRTGQSLCGCAGVSHGTQDQIRREAGRLA